jgi:hypothetical protein
MAADFLEEPTLHNETIVGQFRYFFREDDIRAANLTMNLIVGTTERWGIPLALLSLIICYAISSWRSDGVFGK